MSFHISSHKSVRDVGPKSANEDDPFEFSSPSKSPPKSIVNQTRMQTSDSGATRSSLRLAGSPPLNTNGIPKTIILEKPSANNAVKPVSKATISKEQPVSDSLKLTITTKSGEIKTVKAQTSPSASKPLNFQSLKRTVALTSVTTSVSVEGPTKPKMAKCASVPIMSSTKSNVTSGSGSRLLTSGRKRAVYNPRSWQDDEDSPKKATTSSDAPAKTAAAPDAFDFEEPAPPPPLPKLSGRPNGGLSAMRRSASCTTSSLKVDRSNKALYTVIHHVKDASECQESGETQEFLDEIQYHLDGLRANQGDTTRTLSVLSLAEKCAAHEFRMHMKSHGLWAQVFAKLADCADTLQPELSLSVAGLFYIMSRDRFTCGLDRISLRLMLKLLDARSGSGESIDRARKKLMVILEKCHSENKRKRTPKIQYKSMTPKDLAMEALLSLSVRKATDWFKEEVRLQKGLDHIVEAVSLAVEYFGDELDAQDLNEFMLERLNRIEGFMKLLENMTYKNSENQTYVVELRQRQLMDQIKRCMALCLTNIAFQMDGSAGKRAVASCMLSVLRLLLNCSHDNTASCERLGANMDILDKVLECVLRLPQYLPQNQRFDLLTLSLGFLINLVEHCDENRRRLAHAKVLPCYEADSDEKMEALEALVQLFLLRDEKAQEFEEAAKEEQEKEIAANANKETEEDDDEGKMQWRLIEDRRERRRPVKKRRGAGADDSDEDSEGGESDDGADIEFMPSNEEENTKLQNALSKAGQHMEESMIAAYTALLLGCVVQDNRRLSDRLKMALPDGKLKPMVDSLAKFLSFMSLTSAVGNQGGQSILKIVKLLDELDESGS